MSRRTLAPLLFAGLVGLAACGSSSTTPSNQPTATTVDAMKDKAMTETTDARKDKAMTETTDAMKDKATTTAKP